MKKLMILTGALAAFAVCADQVPVVSGITMTQGDDSRLVTIDYTLANAAAVITLDIQTNKTGAATSVASDWVSIGGENIQNVSGDVWKRVEIGPHTISWRPDLSWPDHEIANGGARAVVTAWSVDNPPDYMVVDLADNVTTNSETYYPGAAFLPGGLDDDAYRIGKIVMRKIAAQGVSWQMGSTEVESQRSSSTEAFHSVTISDNYYIAVFETTQAQWMRVKGSNPSYFTGLVKRPVEQVSYTQIRSSADQWENTNFDYPKEPNPSSFLGLLRTKTGLAFDLPSEVQWEFACRAGHGSGSWGDGSAIQNKDEDGNLADLGRVRYNGGQVKNDSGSYENPATDCEASYGTAIVGSYAPNSWGLYDMHGNVREWCLDGYTENITSLNGAVQSSVSKYRVHRGGSWGQTAKDCRSAARGGLTTSDRNKEFGFRLALPASPALKTE